jgi:hypothetical protein
MPAPLASFESRESHRPVLGKIKQLGLNNRETYTVELLNFPGLYQQMWHVLCAKRHDAEVLRFCFIDNLSRSCHGYLTLSV